MACLRLAFEDWINDDFDDDFPDRPTEEQMAEFEERRWEHDKQLQFLEQRASRLSSSLGSGKISNKQLTQKLPGFMLEGIRYSFEGNAGAEDEVKPGARLLFLKVLSK